METLLANLGLFGLFVGFAALIGFIIVGFRYALTHSKKAPVAESSHPYLSVRKYSDVNIESYRGLIRNISIALSLAIVLAMMEFPSINDNSLVDLTSDARDNLEEMQDIPITEQPPPPPPEIKEIRGAEIIEVEDEEEIEEELKIIFDTEFAEDMAIEEQTEAMLKEEPIAEEEEEEIYLVVEDPAEPIGGYQAFYAHIGNELKYPKKAIKNQTEGKVYVNFVVDKNGDITNLIIARGIGSGCDEEAIRVMKNAPKWHPAKQRGVKVKQSVVIPIHFKLKEM